MNQWESRIISWCAALFGLSAVIVIHEFGHLIAAKCFGIAVPVFSIGFGPTLTSVTIGSTIYQIALLPLGGFVAIDPQALNDAPYFVALTIMLAGILSNMLFAYVVITGLAWWQRHHPESSGFAARHKALIEKSKQTLRKDEAPRGSFVGPLGIFSIMAQSFNAGYMPYLFVIATISMGVGIFNLLPIPPLDGGKILLLTLNAIAGPLSAHAINLIQMAGFILFLFIIFAAMRSDISRSAS